MGNLRKQFTFTMFYTATTVASFMNSTIYWFITRQAAAGNDPAAEPAPPRASDIPAGEGVVWGWGADTTKISNVPDAPCKCWLEDDIEGYFADILVSV